MRIKFVITVTWLSALQVITPAIAQEYSNHKSEEGWTGVISFRSRSTYSSPTGKGFDEWIIEINANQGKVTSNATNNFNKSGPECNNNIAGSQTTSQSIPGFTFTIKTENNRRYFGIDEGMPILRGSRTVCNKKEAIFQDDLAVLIEDLEVGNDPDVISGDTTITTRRKSGSETFDEEVKMSVSLSRRPIDVELLVFPGEYDSWLPLPAKGGTNPGSTMDIAFKVQAKGGGKSPLKVKYFEVELQNTSGEPGIALNAPINAPGRDPDLQFVSYGDNPVSENGQKQRIKPTNEHHGGAMIASFDGGGYTTLVVYAVMENNKRITGQLLKSGGEQEILIPKRKTDSKIGEAWKTRYGNPADEQDDDKSPGNQHHGDGLSAYEEYRGLFAEGRYTRLDPTKKELAVQYLNETEKQNFLKGFDMFSQASGIQIIRLNKDELPVNRVVNANKGYAHLVDQHGLKIRTGQLTNNAPGVNNPSSVLGKTPKLSEQVIIDVTQIKDQFRKQSDIMTKAGLTMPYTLDENIATTVAHEIAHGVHADHHGPPSNEINRMRGFESNIPVRTYDTKGAGFIPDSITSKGSIGAEPCEQSGDITCIMAYNQQYQWAYKKEDNEFHYYLVPPLPVGHNFCTSTTGTGINAGGKYFGNAKNGNCLAQLQVRDP